MASEDEYNAPGTAQPAKLRKAACGIRFDEDELQEGIDFSGAVELKPCDQAPLSTTCEEHRKPKRHL